MKERQDEEANLDSKPKPNSSEICIRKDNLAQYQF